MLRGAFHGLWTLGSIIGAGFRGVVTIMAFTEGGLMRQFYLSRRTIALSSIVLMGLTVGSIVTLVNLGRDQYYRTRMKYLERENRTMISLLQGQAEQLGKLKLEMAKLKEFEESVRQVAGLSVASELQASEPEPAGGRGTSEGRRP
ncbi:hypothetical protein MELA_01599 [Candidatus Methylomirabilis lanthanidiphila]|uniref:Uncharacterized protein n=1 Tax=Candidatus Methylomirabilis lanthanidiphila TaxID=2211376 RepID=A0A564ZKY9_9BACT|nr:hypothetical protein MELA_01599 [Candidatus Methylomirabilis lanthanidiphila]